MSQKHKQGAGKRRRIKDPNAEREAARYARPIPSRDVILQVLEDADRPLEFAGIADALNLHEDVDLEALSRRLGAMLRDGQVVQNRRGKILIPKRAGVIAGTVMAHRDGFGFLIPDEGGDDVFLSPRQMRPLMHNDRAAVRIRGEDRRGRPEGSLVDVLERRTTTLVGRFSMEQGISFVVPDNSRYTQEVLVPPDARDGAQDGQIVLVDIVEQPTKHSQPIGRVSRVLGEHRAAGMEVEIAIHSHGLPHEWPDAVLRQAEQFGDSVPESAKQGRTDLRDLDLVTIDGEDARDFDDAVYAEPRGDGWRLIVAIADVSHYVKPGTPLDNEAQNRATSVYFPDWVIPMLPEALSNGLCSLNPKVDRLCMVCDMQVNARGHVTHAHFYEGVMQSKARLTYTEVGAFFDGDPAARRRQDHLAPRLHALHDLYGALRKARRQRGALDFDRPETKIVFGRDRKIDSIVPVVRNDAHKLIEECMIAANVAGAVFLTKHRMPTLYRIHDRPDPDRIQQLRDFLGPLGLSLGGGEKPEPKHFAKLIEAVQARSDRDLIEMVVLRSLAQAVYHADDIGHFGLSHSTYLHFTSPIRRYPDLLVHRAIRHVVRGGTAETFAYSLKDMEMLGSRCSMAERRADEATRDAVNWLKCDYMSDKLGEEFDGVVMGVTNFGIFVALSGLDIEGLVHVTALPDDYYQFDAARHCLVGERSGRVFQLTDRVRVKVARVDLEERKIDFDLVAAPDAAPAERRARRKRRR